MTRAGQAFFHSFWFNSPCLAVECQGHKPNSSHSPLSQHELSASLKRVWQEWDTFLKPLKLDRPEEKKVKEEMVIQDISGE